MFQEQKNERYVDLALPIDRKAVYPEIAVRRILDHLPESVFVKARRTGELRFSRLGRQIFYRGDWILDWLLSGADTVPCEGGRDG